VRRVTQIQVARCRRKPPRRLQLAQLRLPTVRRRRPPERELKLHPCVVPIAVQDTIYFEGTTVPEGEDPPLVELRRCTRATPGHTGLVNLGPGNRRSHPDCGVRLEPNIPTKPGLKGGDFVTASRTGSRQPWPTCTQEEAKPPSDGSPALQTVNAVSMHRGYRRCVFPVLLVDINTRGQLHPLAQLVTASTCSLLWVDGMGPGTQAWEHGSLATRTAHRGPSSSDEPVDRDVFDRPNAPGEADCVLDFDPGQPPRSSSYLTNPNPRRRTP